VSGKAEADSYQATVPLGLAGCLDPRGRGVRTQGLAAPGHRFFLFGILEGRRLFHAHAIKHARENRNVGLVLDQRTEMIGVK
jgi:hypothetical protein